MDPNVLIISNTCFSYSSNLGRTLCNLFDGWAPDRLAQLYFHSGIPSENVCHSYFRFSDADAIKSVVKRNHDGTKIYNLAAIDTAVENGKMTALGYTVVQGRKSLFVRLARESWWALSNWDSPKLREWLREISPQVILFVVGDCLFAYRIVNKLAEELHIPVVPICLDDYLSEPDGHRSIIDRALQNLILKNANDTFSRSKFLLTTCERMSRDYVQKYGLECREIYTVASKPIAPVVNEQTICYFGNISLGRWKSLLAIGRAVKDLGYGSIHVYSGEDIGIAKKTFIEQNGIFFHGSISYQEVKEKTSQSLMLLHVESFDPEYAKTVRYSMSTKIADSLASGVCLFAYGPSEVNSIQYLKQNHAAYVVTDEKNLKAGLQDILRNENLRDRIIQNAKSLAQINHSKEHNQTVLLEVLNGTIAADSVGKANEETV